VLQTIAYSTTTGATNAFASETYQVRLTSTSACNYQIGDGTQTASTTTSPLLPALTDRYVTVSPGQKIAAVTAASNGAITATNGTLYIMELQ
jgi:hypothetical protein